MLVPAHLIDGCSFQAGIEFASIKFSIRQSQPPGRLKEGRVVNPPEAAPTVTHCRKRLYVSSANVRRREHLSGYRSREARVDLVSESLDFRKQSLGARGKESIIVAYCEHVIIDTVADKASANLFLAKAARIDPLL